VARYAARYADLEFEVAGETMALMCTMVRAGEADALVPERVWQELCKALTETRPSRFFEVLRECGALARLLPELDRLFGIPQPQKWHPEIDTGVHTLMVVDMAARLSKDPEVVFAALTHDLGKGTTPAEILPRHKGHEERSVSLIDDLCLRLRVPRRFCELARIAARYHGLAHKVDELRPGTILDMFQGADAFRRPERFGQVLTACEADYRGRRGYEERQYLQGSRLRRLLAAVLAVDVGAVAASAAEPSKIPEAIRDARVRALRAAMNEV
jgi:tRNA nucleotidyltransferase (CCA-adding enzyme)